MADEWLLWQDLLWTVVIAAIANTSCAILGCYLVLRRMSLLGDAISHAVLPGLIVAFLLTGSLSIGWLFCGALVTGLLTTYLTQLLQRQGGMNADASMGVVFTSLFALGVVLLNRFLQDVHFDASCVWEGQLENVLTFGGARYLWTVGPVLAINLAFVVIFWKELKLSAFDPALATTMGLSAGVMHYLLMGLVAVTTVASFEQVGSILVIAMLIVPGATAHLLTDRLHWMLVLSAVVAILSAILGVWAGVHFNVPMAGAMSVAAGLLYLSAVLAAPRYGILSALVRNLRTSARIVGDDVVAMLYRLEELAFTRRLGAREAAEAVGGGWLAHASLFWLYWRGQVVRAEGGITLTTSGRDRAEHLVRGHRLWEAYLVEHLNLPVDHVHAAAERTEHFLDRRLQQQIAEDLQQPNHDPHGRHIPTVTSAQKTKAEPPTGAKD